MGNRQGSAESRSQPLDRICEFCFIPLHETSAAPQSYDRRRNARLNNARLKRKGGK
jgi:hypothetical protein